MSTDTGIAIAFTMIQVGSLTRVTRVPSIEMKLGIASHELGGRVRVADTAKVRGILDAQLDRMDDVFRKLL